MIDVPAETIDLAADQFKYFLLVFCRISAALSMAPPFGESYMAGKGKWTLSFLLSLVLTPSAEQLFATPPASGPLFFVEAIGEGVAGILLGACIKAFCACMHLAGMAFSYQAGLSAAVIYDPSQATFGAVSSVFLGITATAFIFATDMHLFILQALRDSYAIIPLGGFQPNHYAEAYLKCLAMGFNVAVRLSMPYLIAGFLFQCVSGMTSRMSPQMQVFFALAPLQILVALSVLSVTVGISMNVFSEELLSVLAFFEKP